MDKEYSRSSCRALWAQTSILYGSNQIPEENAAAFRSWNSPPARVPLFSPALQDSRKYEHRYNQIHVSCKEVDVYEVKDIGET